MVNSVHRERNVEAPLREWERLSRRRHDRSDFSVVARVEALIAGWPQDEALRRALAYADAGADAVLIHSKESEPDQVLEFMARWTGGCPVVIVPTMYWSTPASVFADAGVSLVIWAKVAQPGSFSKSQCDLLLGSFQIMQASITGRLRAQGKPRRIAGPAAWRGGR